MNYYFKQVSVSVNNLCTRCLVNHSMIDEEMTSSKETNRKHKINVIFFEDYFQYKSSYFCFTTYWCFDWIQLFIIIRNSWNITVIICLQPSLGFILVFATPYVERSVKTDNNMPGIIINTQCHVNKFSRASIYMINRCSKVSIHKQTRVLSYLK